MIRLRSLFLLGFDDARCGSGRLCCTQAHALLLWAGLASALLCAGCANECSSLTCADGCCAAGVCYVGAAVKGGATCRDSTATGGGTASGTGGGSTMAIDAGPARCLPEHSTCVVGSTPCCTLTIGGYFMACAAGRCATCVQPYKKCSAGTPCCAGTCDSSGYCPGSAGGACGTYAEPCNANNPCCSDFDSSLGRVCFAERCGFCNNPNAECTATKDCCPGLVCAVKPGFTSIKTCQ